MKTNNEVTIAILVGALMVLICVIIYAVNTNDVKTDDIVIQVFKYNEETELYYECSISPEDKLTINKQIARLKNKTIEDSLSGTQINGDYKIVVNNEENNFYAFDKEHDNKIYIGDQNRLYKFNSDVYEIVINACK